MYRMYADSPSSALVWARLLAVGALLCSKCGVSCFKDTASSTAKKGKLPQYRGVDRPSSCICVDKTHFYHHDCFRCDVNLCQFTPPDVVSLSSMSSYNSSVDFNMDASASSTRGTPHSEDDAEDDGCELSVDLLYNELNAEDEAPARNVTRSAENGPWREPYNPTPMGGQLLAARTPHMALSTCGEPDETMKNTHPCNSTSPQWGVSSIPPAHLHARPMYAPRGVRVDEPAKSLEENTTRNLLMSWRNILKKIPTRNLLPLFLPPSRPVPDREPPAVQEPRRVAHHTAVQDSGRRRDPAAPGPAPALEAAHRRAGGRGGRQEL